MNPDNKILNSYNYPPTFNSTDFIQHQQQPQIMFNPFQQQPTNYFNGPSPYFNNQHQYLICVNPAYMSTIPQPPLLGTTPRFNNNLHYFTTQRHNSPKLLSSTAPLPANNFLTPPKSSLAPENNM